MAELDFAITADPEVGTYEATITRAGFSNFKDTGERQLYVILAVEGGEYAGAEIPREFRIYATTGAKFYAIQDINELQNAVGIKKLTDSDQFLGKKVRFDYVTDDYGKKAQHFQKPQNAYGDDDFVPQQEEETTPLSQSKKPPF